MKTAIRLLVLAALLLPGCQPRVGPEIFSFEVDGIRLVGLLDTPAHQNPASSIILVHGYGPTNVVEQNAFAELRAAFTRIGLNVLVWDKPGCGQSEGVFDINQPVESSAREVVAAVEALKSSGLPGTEHVGLWGISRAGWIAPLAIQAEPAINYWISVSGVSDKENARYLLSANLPIEGRTPAQTERVVGAWQRAVDVTSTGGPYDEYMQVATVLSDDPFVQFMGWGEPATRESFLAYQEQYQRGELLIDEDTGLPVYIADFSGILESLNIPVLAVFGALDTNVDWQETAKLYQQTIGENPSAELSVRVFEGANHILKQAETGGIREMNAAPGDAPHVEGYIETMTDWLVANGFGLSAD